MLGAGDVEDFAGAFVVAGNAGADGEVCTATDEQLEGARSVTPGQAPTALRGFHGVAPSNDEITGCHDGVRT